MRTMKKLAAAVAVVSALTMTAACGSDEPADTAANDETTSQAPSDEESAPSEESDVTSELAGPGCEAYAEQVPDGDGSVQGMSEDPVAVAASNNPLLKTLTATVSGQFNPKVDLVDTLNGDEFTVFAPVDDAFNKLPKKTLKALAKPENADMLQSILTYHVVPGQMTPEEIAGTTQPTAEGDKVKISGDPDSLKVNDANVICGGVQTANATVYLIDSVLSPQM